MTITITMTVTMDKTLAIAIAIANLKAMGSAMSGRTNNLLIIYMRNSKVYQ